MDSINVKKVDYQIEGKLSYHETIEQINHIGKLISNMKIDGSEKMDKWWVFTAKKRKESIQSLLNLFDEYIDLMEEDEPKT